MRGFASAVVLNRSFEGFGKGEKKTRRRPRTAGREGRSQGRDDHGASWGKRFNPNPITSKPCAPAKLKDQERCSRENRKGVSRGQNLVLVGL